MKIETYENLMLKKIMMFKYIEPLFPKEVKALKTCSKDYDFDKTKNQIMIKPKSRCKYRYCPICEFTQADILLTLQAQNELLKSPKTQEILNLVLHEQKSKIYRRIQTIMRPNGDEDKYPDKLVEEQVYNYVKTGSYDGANMRGRGDKIDSETLKLDLMAFSGQSNKFNSMKELATKLSLNQKVKNYNSIINFLHKEKNLKLKNMAERLLNKASSKVG